MLDVFVEARVKMSHTAMNCRIDVYESIWSASKFVRLIFSGMFSIWVLKCDWRLWCDGGEPPCDTDQVHCPAPSLLCCLSDWYKLYTIQKISSLTRFWNGWGPRDNEAITVMWPTPWSHLLVSPPLTGLFAVWPHREIGFCFVAFFWFTLFQK